MLKSIDILYMMMLDIIKEISRCNIIKMMLLNHCLHIFSIDKKYSEFILKGRITIGCSFGVISTSTYGVF
jgi:hypothetical protein